jgi:hypothetical protein
VETVTTNLLAMPLVTLTVVTGTNEDWIDSIKFVVDDGSTDPPQLDLTGIQFDMEVRRLPPDNEVILRASTTDGTLAVGAAPDFGFLLINVDHEQMKIIRPDNYTADIVGTDGDTIRRCIIIDLEIALGITRP